MSAWAELLNHDGSDEWLDLCNRALTEVQAETSRRNAAKQRAELDVMSNGPRYIDDREWMRRAEKLPDLIDPEAVPPTPDTHCVGCGNPQDNGQVHGHGAGYGGCV
jgi:hypothetical protein